MSQYSDNDEQFHYLSKDCGFNYEDTEEIKDPSCPKCNSAFGGVFKC